MISVLLLSDNGVLGTSKSIGNLTRASILLLILTDSVHYFANNCQIRLDNLHKLNYIIFSKCEQFAFRHV